MCNKKHLGIKILFFRFFLIFKIENQSKENITFVVYFGTKFIYNHKKYEYFFRNFKKDDKD
jgi:hypothetical protein